MLCNSLVDLSSIHIKDKSDDDSTKGDIDGKSGSSHSIEAPVKSATNSPNSNLRTGSAMTMKQIDAELNTLRRENFDLKLRLYVENQKKGPKKSLPIDYDDQKDKPTENLKKILLDKNSEIRVLKNELHEMENKMEFEVGILRREKEAYANDLQASQAVCRSFIEHLTEVREFWRKFLLETSSNCGNKTFIDSLTNWLSSSQELLNNSSMLVTEERINESIKEAKEITKSFASNKFSSNNDANKLNELKGMSSLGLLADLSHFITIDAKPIPMSPKTSKDTQTELLSTGLQSLIDNERKLKDKVYLDHFVQTEAVVAAEMKEKACQSNLPTAIDQNVQTECQPKQVDEWLQTDLLISFPKSTQTNHEMKDCETQTERKKGKKLVKTPSRVPVKESSCLKQARVDVCKNVLEENRVTPAKSLYSFRTTLSPICESPKVNKKSTPNSLPEGKNVVRNTGVLTYSPGNLKVESSAKSKRSPQPLGNPATRLLLADGMVKMSANQTVDQSKRVLAPLAQENGRETIKKPSRMDKNQYLVSKVALVKESDGEMATIKLTGSDDGGTSDYEQHEAENSVRVYLSFRRYQLLRGNLSQLSVHLNELESLHKDHLLLEIVDKSEYSSAIISCFSNMRHTINSSRIICHHFTIVDENSVLAQFEKIKAKKENIEKAITQQMKKADKLLKKAKINLRA